MALHENFLILKKQQQTYVYGKKRNHHWINSSDINAHRFTVNVLD